MFQSVMPETNRVFKKFKLDFLSHFCEVSVNPPLVQYIFMEIGDVFFILT